MSTLKPLLKTAGAGFMLGCCIYGAGDVLGDYTTYTILRDRAVVLATENDELKDQIGHPFSLGPWYNASIGFASGGALAQCTFQLQGTKQVTDVTVRGLRGAGVRNNAIYNIVGDGQWKVIDCKAMFPSGGGLVKPKSLLPANGEALEALGAQQHGSSSGSEASSSQQPNATASRAQPGSSTPSGHGMGSGHAGMAARVQQHLQQHQQSPQSSTDQQQQGVAQPKKRAWWRLW